MLRCDASANAVAGIVVTLSGDGEFDATPIYRSTRGSGRYQQICVG